MIKTTSTDQDEILLGILELCSIKQFSADICYSKGNFYKNHVPQPIFKSDIYPQAPGVVAMDARNLSFGNESLKSIIFDPPFLATKGPSLKEENKSNKIAKRFSVFPTEKELFQFYNDVIVECYRVLKKKGFLVVKCQDKVSSGKQYFSHVYIHEMALAAGFYPKDLFILINENKMLGKWAKGPQQHAIKTHSYFWVFKKRQPKVYLTKLLDKEV